FMPGTSNIHTKDFKDPYQRCQNYISEIPNKYTARTPKQIYQELQNNNILETSKIYTCTLIEPQPALLHLNWLLFC
ncbi:22859_t:CDS:1, partial [Dentiscutata erythropus]